MKATSRWRAALNFHLLTDTQREGTLTGIEKVAQQSALIQIPAIAASYAALTAKGITFATSLATARATQKQFKASVGALDLARAAFDLELDTFKTLVGNNATSGADITGMGFTLLSVIKASKTPPDPPGAVLVRLGKVHGKARVAVAGTGNRGRFLAEVATDPIGVWSPLPGNGKERKLSGYASGTKLWVRFAAVRWGMQSGWSVPVLVTIP